MKIKRKRTDSLSLKGIHTFTLSRPSGEQGLKLYDRVKELDQRLKVMLGAGLRHTSTYFDLAREFKETLARFNLACGFFTRVIENVTPTEGRTILARALSGDLTDISQTEINYTALGSGAGTPAASDNALGAESYRKLISSATYESNIAYITGFYMAGEATGTHEEHGLFIAGTASADSGSIISRLLLSGLVKGASETLTVDTSLTIADA